MIELFTAGRGAGKTYWVLSQMAQDSAVIGRLGMFQPILVCPTKVWAENCFEHAKLKFPRINWRRNQFVCCEDWELVRGRAVGRVYVDGADEILRRLYGNVAGATWQGPANDSQDQAETMSAYVRMERERTGNG